MPDPAHVPRTFQARVRVYSSGELSGVGLLFVSQFPNTVGGVARDKSLKRPVPGGGPVDLCDQARGPSSVLSGPSYPKASIIVAQLAGPAKRPQPIANERKPDLSVQIPPAQDRPRRRRLLESAG